MSDHHKIKYGILSVIFSTLLLIGCTYHSASLPSDGSAKAGSSDTAYGNEAASSYVSASAKENVNPVRIQVDNNPRDGSPANTPDLSPSSDDEFYISPISDDLFEKMLGNSYKEGCPVSREDLKYLHILHTDIDGNVLEGELVCHRLIADDLLEIFRELYDAAYPIEKVCLIDEYGGDDEKSMTDDNSSCFNFRTIRGSSRVSKHGLGLAVDINTLYNPYVKSSDLGLTVQPAAGEAYADRDKDFPYKICETDLCCRLFARHGFEWGGSWKSVKDYQHFELPDSALSAMGIIQ